MFKKKSKAQPSEELFWFIDAHNDDDAPDGAWFQMLEDSVTYWNDRHGTNFDENDTVHAYLEWREKPNAQEEK